VSDPDGVGLISAELRKDLAEILYCEPAEVDDQATFTEMGLDSILGLEFLAVINTRYGLKENIDAVYDHPTVPALSQYLDARRSGGSDRS
jgi:aryl carrier-like protein